MNTQLLIPLDCNKYFLNIYQDSTGYYLYTDINLTINTDDNKKYQSDISELADKKTISLSDHLELVAKKVIEDINRQIREKQISTDTHEESLIEIDSGNIQSTSNSKKKVSSISDTKIIKKRKNKTENN